MQQAIYNKIMTEIVLSRNAATQKTATGILPVGKQLARRIAHQWDFWGICALLGSCGAYGIYALAYVA